MLANGDKIVASKLSTDLEGFIGDTKVMKKKESDGQGFKSATQEMLTERENKL